ncbi:MAG: FAD-dependent oxidoreductase, partial [Candidatus Omnitrophica bacterium]|nr:FAD-dependent oxidoreductase [Candidatus Omnitrophota bacterium]
MKKIIIIGGGFAGISAVSKLRQLGETVDIVLIDSKEEFNFLPMLPDIIGRRIRPDFLEFKLPDFCQKTGAKFIKDEVIKIDLENNTLFSSKDSYHYDYLIIASGSETNFYGNEAAKKHGFKLDSTKDAIAILDQLGKNIFDTFIIAGGGYTGIEVAT